MRPLLAFALLVAGCGDDDVPTDPPPVPDGDAAVAPDASVPPPPPADAARPPPVPLPEGFGWSSLPGTTIQGACPYDEDPQIRGIEGCSAIIEDWAGGIADTRRNRLIVWGGGHGGYFGNELYALDLESQQMLRLNDASPPWPDTEQCSPETADGMAASRHTYDGLAYIEHADKMFVFGGAPACYPGGLSNDTWTFDFATMTWERRDPHEGGTPGARPGVVADYDPETRLVYLHDTYAFWSYDVDTNTYTMLRNHIDDGVATDYHLVGRVDVRRRLFVIVGNGEAWSIDIGSGSGYALEPVSLGNCDAILDVVYPGMTYDPNLDGMVAWGGGDSLYVLDPDTWTCTELAGSDGPGPQVGNGTNGRFRYFPSLDVYALVNQWDQDSFLFRPVRE